MSNTEKAICTVQFNHRILDSNHINLIISSQKIVQYKYSETEINRVQPDIKQQHE